MAKKFNFQIGRPYVNGKGAKGAKPTHKPGCVSRRMKRYRNLCKRQKKKDRNVFVSSHGKFKTVEELMATNPQAGAYRRPDAR